MVQPPSRLSDGVLADRVERCSSEVLLKAAELLQEISATTNSNKLYQLCLSLLKLGGLEAEVPRLVVFGQQSMGKTTLLDYIMGGPVGYSSTDTGTRMPVVMILQPSPDDTYKCSLNGRNIPIGMLQTEMAKLMQSVASVTATAEAEVKIGVPGGVYAVFVDLPGIKDDSKVGAELTRSIVRNYVHDNPNDLYILVKKTSDDPANWPWSLREFILSRPPSGLGLSETQTVVVGTRAVEFLNNEKNDINTQEQLLTRVNERSIQPVNCAGTKPFALFLLELFSLSLDLKSSGSFENKRSEMLRQILEGQELCQSTITNAFAFSGKDVQRQLCRIFDAGAFQQHINNMFQALLTRQLEKLERRLRVDVATLTTMRDRAEDELVNAQPTSVRDQIHLVYRELVSIAEKLITGSYRIVSMKGNGKDFLEQFGGSLSDNLKDGHLLAVELFSSPRPDSYNAGFLDTLTPPKDLSTSHSSKSATAAACSAADAVTRPTYEAEKKRRHQTSVSKAVSGAIASATPVVSQKAAATQWVLYHKSRLLAQLLKSDENGDGHLEFSYTEKGKLMKIVRVCKEGEWIDVEPLRCSIDADVLKQQIQDLYRLRTSEDSWTQLEQVTATDWNVEGEYVTLKVDAEGHQSKKMAPLDDFFCRTRMASRLLTNIKQGASNIGHNVKCAVSNSFSSLVTPSTTTGESCTTDSCNSYREIAEIAAPLTSCAILSDWANVEATANVKLLNQLSLTFVCRWLKCHVKRAQPTQHFDEEVLLQQVRTLDNVVDKGVWEPCVADSVQANIRGGLLQLVRLASCAAAVALRRILLAACSEVVRTAQPSWRRLVTNELFVSHLNFLLVTYCQKRAIACAEAMEALLCEQTHVVHFDLIDDVLTAHVDFEREFADSTVVSKTTVIPSGPKMSADREDAPADAPTPGDLPPTLRTSPVSIFTKRLFDELRSGATKDVLREAARVHFWAIKYVLAAPLATKLYMHFVKDIREKSFHLAFGAEHGEPQRETLECYLQRHTLFEDESLAGRKAFLRSEDSLVQQFSLNVTTEAFECKLKQTQNLLQYTQLAITATQKFRGNLVAHGNVNFLMRLSAIK